LELKRALTNTAGSEMALTVNNATATSRNEDVSCPSPDRYGECRGAVADTEREHELIESRLVVGGDAEAASCTFYLTARRPPTNVVVILGTRMGATRGRPPSLTRKSLPPSTPPIKSYQPTPA
jgi:hypothetical protein